MLDIDFIKKTTLTTRHSSGGSNFKTHILTKTSNGYSFKASIGAILFASVFGLAGFAIFAFGVYKIIDSGTFFMENIFLILFGAIFLAAGIYLFYKFLSPRVFNKTSNNYYNGFKRNNIKLNRIVALQLIGETIDGKNSSYKSFELNLVLDDASRVNVIDHGNLKKLIIDTEVLSTFLNVPIWHAESKNS